jgi:hypothetical protein
MPPRKTTPKAEPKAVEGPQEVVVGENGPETVSRPQHQRQRVTEGEKADIQRLVPSPITEAARKSLNLWQKRALMIEELGTVPKRGWNDHHKYNYALEADVVAYLGPLMAKYMVVTTVDVLLDRVERIEMSQTRSGGTMTLTRLPMVVTFINADNPEERDTVTWIGEGSDTGDKGVYKSYTGGLKYLYLKWFMIATGDDPEAFERTDALNESGGRQGVEALGGETDVRQAQGRRQPQRGGRQNETTNVQIRTLGNLSVGLGYGPRGTAEVIDQTLGTYLTDTLTEIDDEDAQRHALVEFLRGRPGEDTGKVIHAMTQIAEKAAQEKSSGLSDEEEAGLLKQAQAEVAADDEALASTVEQEPDDGGAAPGDAFGSGS